MGEVEQIGVKLSWHKKFIAPTPIPNPTHGPAPGSARELGPELRGAPRSTRFLVVTYM